MVVEAQGNPFNNIPYVSYTGMPFGADQTTSCFMDDFVPCFRCQGPTKAGLEEEISFRSGGGGDVLPSLKLT